MNSAAYNDTKTIKTNQEVDDTKKQCPQTEILVAIKECEDKRKQSSRNQENDNHEIYSF